MLLINELINNHVPTYVISYITSAVGTESSNNCRNYINDSRPQFTKRN